MAYSIILTSNKVSQLKQLRRNEKDGKLLRRYQCNIDTVTDWIKQFNKGRIAGVNKRHYEARRPSGLDAVKDLVLKYIKEQSISKLSELQDFLDAQHSIVVEHSWLSRYCKKNSIALTKRQD